MKNEICNAKSKMRPNHRNFVILGVIICLLIALMSPFIASSNPDGLEKSAEQIATAQDGGTYEAPYQIIHLSLWENLVKYLRWH